MPALALLVAIAAGTWALLGRGGQPTLPAEGPVDAAASREAPGEAEVAVGARTDVELAPEPTEVEVRSDAADDELEQRLPEEIDYATERIGPLVRVVRGREPVPDVEVAWVDQKHAFELRKQRGEPIETYDLPHRYGQRARTNAAGELHLPPADALLLVAVRTRRSITPADGVEGAAGREEFAAGTIRRGQKGLVLRLAIDETLYLSVVDEEGRGRAAVPLEVQHRPGDRGDVRTLWSGTADARGRATIHHFQLFRRPAAKTESYALAAHVPLTAPERSFVAFAARPAPTEPVTLVLPTTRPLELALVHRSGAPVLAPLTIALDSSHQYDPAWPVAPQLARVTAEKPVGSEPVLLPHLGPGVQLTPSLDVVGARRAVALPPFAVPEPGAGDGHVALTLPDACIVLAARLCDAAGAPLADRRIECALRSGQRAVTTRFATLADGRGDVVFMTPTANQAAALLLREVLPDGTTIGCTVDLAVLSPGERRDLATLRLAPLPRVASGRIHDDRGVGVEGAQVHIEQLVTTSRGERWLPAPMLVTRSDADGRFTLDGEIPRAAFRVGAHAARHFPAQTEPLTPGAVVDLQVMRAGALKGRVVLPEWMDPGAASVVLVAAVIDDADAEIRSARARGQRTDLRERGVFWLGSLEPGLYRAVVMVRNLPEPLATIEGLRIDPGVNEDPRLAPLDLATALYRYRLRAIGPGGRPLADLDGPILWRTQQPSGEQTVVGFRWQKGAAELVVPVPYLELTTLGKGLAPTTLALAAGDHDVYLPAVQPFVVVLPGVRGTCGANRAIRVSAIATGDSDLPQGLSGTDQRTGEGFSFPRWELGKSGGGWLDAFDRAEIVVSRPGPHQIVLRVYEGEQQTGRQASLELGTVEVKIDGSQASPAILAVDLAQLATTVAALTPDPAAAQRPR